MGLTNKGLSSAAESLLSFRSISLGASNELLANLWVFRNRLATLDYDKVYGLMGLVRSSKFRLQPDYQKAVPSTLSRGRGRRHQTQRQPPRAKRCTRRTTNFRSSKRYATEFAQPFDLEYRLEQFPLLGGRSTEDSD
jgi:hypothetical protein